MKRSGDLGAGPRRGRTVDRSYRTVMTIGDWIDQRERPVPSEFRSHLSVGGPASPHILLRAAEREITGCTVENPRDLGAAFSLLAADAYVTYACALAMMEDADASRLTETARRVAHGWWEHLR